MTIRTGRGSAGGGGGGGGGGGPVESLLLNAAHSTPATAPPSVRPALMRRSIGEPSRLVIAREPIAFPLGKTKTTFSNLESYLPLSVHTLTVCGGAWIRTRSVAGESLS